MQLWWLWLLQLLVYWGTQSRLELELLCWWSLLMHPSLRCTIVLMFCQ
jgi:hypothetical protein